MTRARPTATQRAAIRRALFFGCRKPFPDTARCIRGVTLPLIHEAKQ